MTTSQPEGYEPVTIYMPAPATPPRPTIDDVDGLAEALSALTRRVAELEQQPEPNPEPVHTPAYPGQPPAGRVLWGASLSGNSDPTNKHEQPTGVPLSIRRTFQPSWSQQRINTMAAIAATDLAAGRLPWVSIKPAPWAQMETGRHDALIDSMLTQLAALPGPVWLTIHHEPDGGGGTNAPDDPAGPAGHLAMNARIRQRMTALGTGNIALAPILMAYTWVPSAPHRNPDLWWDSEVYDFMGVDQYSRDGSSLIGPTWNKVREWGHANGCDINVGEWGIKGTDDDTPGHFAEWFEMAAASAEDVGMARVSGLSYFDSDLNTDGGGYTLGGRRLAAFHELLTDPRTVRWGDYHEAH